MLSLEIVTRGPEWEPVYWNRLAEGFERDLAHLLGLWVRKLATEAKRRARVDTGQLRASIVGEVFRKAGTFLGVVGTNLPTAYYQEFGTGIHSTWPGAPRKRITAKNGKALKIPIGRFGSVRAAAFSDAQAVDPIGPRSMVGSIFRHSIAGVKPQPFLTPLMAEFGPTIEADLLRLCQRYGFV